MRCLRHFLPPTTALLARLKATPVFFDFVAAYTRGTVGKHTRNCLESRQPCLRRLTGLFLSNPKKHPVSRVGRGFIPEVLTKQLFV